METIRAAIDEMIASNDTIFREILSSLPRKSFWKRISSRDPGAGSGSGAFCYCVAGYSSLYTFIPLTRASGGSGELERRQFLREFFHTFLYAFHSPSAGLVPSVQVVPELGLIHSGDALESGK